MAAPSSRQAPAGLAVSLRGVARAFRSEQEGVVPVLAGIDLEVAGGEFVSLLGPSGCGKSTLLRIVAGLDRQDAGEVRLEGVAPGPEARRGIAYVFQDPLLLPWQVGLGDAERRFPAQLSGGMRMRVSLARALVTAPRLLLLDEPFAALDEITRQDLDDQLRELWHRTGTTVLFVTHSIVEAAFLADRAVVLSRRPARLVLDHRLELPPRRSGALRASAEFAAQTRFLFEALRDGGEAAA
jgi:NitT/TauT family transport system ATP-binding protein